MWDEHAQVRVASSSLQTRNLLNAYLFAFLLFYYCYDVSYVCVCKRNQLKTARITKFVKVLNQT